MGFSGERFITPISTNLSFSSHSKRGRTNFNKGGGGTGSKSSFLRKRADVNLLRGKKNPKCHRMDHGERDENHFSSKDARKKRRRGVGRSCYSAIFPRKGMLIVGKELR